MTHTRLKANGKRDRSRFAVLPAANRIWFKESNGNLQCKLGALGSRWTSRTHTVRDTSVCLFCLLSNLSHSPFFFLSRSCLFLSAFPPTTYSRLFRYADAPFPATDHSALYASSLYGETKFIAEFVTVLIFLLIKRGYNCFFLPGAILAFLFHCRRWIDSLKHKSVITFVEWKWVVVLSCDVRDWWIDNDINFAWNRVDVWLILKSRLIDSTFRVKTPALSYFIFVFK